MIKIEHLYKSYGDISALTDINITIDEGKVTALIGENGAGKSTLMRLMCGYIYPTSGRVSINGYDIDTQRLSALSQIGYVPEISSLYEDMRVYDFLDWIAGIWKLDNKKQHIIEAAQNMQILPILSERIKTLSKGYKKRVEIASAILHSPKILILDEPSDGLDPNQKHHIRQFMKQYAKKNTVLVSTHVLEDAKSADDIIMLAQGKLIKHTSISEFRKISPTKDLGDAFRILSHL